MSVDSINQNSVIAQHVNVPAAKPAAVPPVTVVYSLTTVVPLTVCEPSFACCAFAVLKHNIATKTTAKEEIFCMLDQLVR